MFARNVIRSSSNKHSDSSSSAKGAKGCFIPQLFERVGTKGIRLAT